MRKTNFDKYLEEQLKDPTFAEQYKKADEAWDLAIQISAFRRQAGFSQKDLARRLKTSQQSISRLESASYRGHSMAMLRRVAAALGARVRVVFEPDQAAHGHLAEASVPYRVKRKSARSHGTGTG